MGGVCTGGVYTGYVHGFT